jgi:type IV/VI secretion system ImpK/VasF family protein
MASTAPGKNICSTNRNTMKLVPYNESFLLSQFREFYTEVIRLKCLIKSEGWVAPAATGSGNGNLNGNGSALDTGTWVYFPAIDFSPAAEAFPETEKSQSLAVRSASQGRPHYDFADQPLSADQAGISVFVWQSMLALFRRNAMNMLRVSGTPGERYLEAQYVMAAFADEVFIHLDWEGKSTWTSNLLESTIFHSHVAGELFFEKLERLLRDRDPADKSLAAVYLTALALGFRGKYHDVDDHGRLSYYRRELFAFAFSQPSDLANAAKVAFPDAYVHGLRPEARRKLTNPKLWVAVLGIVFFSYLLISHGVWLSLTSRLERTAGQIVETENRLNSIPITTR